MYFAQRNRWLRAYFPFHLCILNSLHNKWLFSYQCINSQNNSFIAREIKDWFYPVFTMSFDDRRKKLTTVSCRSGKKHGQILCQLCAGGEESSTITFCTHQSRNRTARRGFFPAQNKEPEFTPRCRSGSSFLPGPAPGEPPAPRRTLPLQHCAPARGTIHLSFTFTQRTKCSAAL